MTSRPNQLPENPASHCGVGVVRLPGRVAFSDALALQDRLVGEIGEGIGCETLLLLEHEPVYTIGRTRDRSSLRSHLPHPAIETNRGGLATYHGPGQLVGYPILDLNRRGRDLHRYLRFLEDFLIGVCAKFGVEARCRDGLTGVWAGEKKLASLGVGVKKWVSMHGFALNVKNECLPPFRHITPCGIAGVEMTSLEQESGGQISFDEVADLAEISFPALLEARLPG